MLLSILYHVVYTIVSLWFFVPSIFFYRIPRFILVRLLSLIFHRQKNNDKNERIDDLGEIDGGPLLNKLSVFSHIELGLIRHPHGLAVISTHQPAKEISYLTQNATADIDCAALTYEQIHSISLKLVAGLTANGVRPDSTMLMLIPNGVEYCLLLWTCILMRLTFVCLDLSELGKTASDELQYKIQILKPSIIVVPDGIGANVIDGIMKTNAFRINLGKDTPNGWKSLRDLLADASRAALDIDDVMKLARNDNRDRIHSIMFTSGTSGRPKGCPLTVRGMSHVLQSQSWLINKDNCARALQQAHNSRGIAPAQTLQTWKEGGAVVMTGKGFSVDDMAMAIENHRVTFIVLTPPMVHGMAEYLAAHPSLSVDSVDTIQIGGDAVTKDTLVKCANLFPGAKVCINHGMTEGGGAFRWLSSQADVPHFGNISSVGTVAAGAIVRTWDRDAGRLSRRGQAGELHISCGSLIPGYLGGVSSDSFYTDRKGRWFNTGDMAMIDRDGLVYILGRRKDLINRNGVAVMPAAVESCIEAFIGVQASVVPVPHPALGFEPYAVVKSLNGKGKNEIQSHVFKSLGKDYSLGGVLPLRGVGLAEFPVNATHKVIRFEVERAVLQYLERNR